MADKFQNKYRIPSARLQHWDMDGMPPILLQFAPKTGNVFLGKLKMVQ